MILKHNGEVYSPLDNHVYCAADALVAACDVLDDICSVIEKLLTAFFPHFLSATEGPDGWHLAVGSLW